MILGHVIALDPTVEQSIAMARACGVARFTFNWGLGEWNRQYEAGEKPTAAKLKKQFNAIKGAQFPWIYESPRDANSQAFADLGRLLVATQTDPQVEEPEAKDLHPIAVEAELLKLIRVGPDRVTAVLKGIGRRRIEVTYSEPYLTARATPVTFKNFFDSLSGKRKGPKIGRPTFRKRGQNDAFYVANDRFHFDGNRVVLPVIGAVKIREALRFDGKILSGRVRRRAGRWFLAVQVEVGEVRRPVAEERRAIVGVDLGLKTAIVTSAGAEIAAPKPLRKSLKRLRRANRKLHRRQKGGQNRYKARMAVARIHRRVADVRKDFWHKATTDLCRENQTVVIEDLSLNFMLRNRCLSLAASDCALGMFRPMMEYKGPIYDCYLVVADRFFPSTKRCSCCGHIKAEMLLSERVYRCEVCGLVLDRDLNAALNLEAYPRLRETGGWLPPTPSEIGPLLGTKRASPVAELGTKPCSLVGTN